MRLVIGLVMTVLALAIAGRRVFWLYRLLKSGQPAPGRLDGIGARAKDQLLEVFGQRKLLKWTVPGAAHFFMFWGFVILAATILEAYGALFDRDFAIPLIGHWPLLGFLEDFFAVAVLVALAVFSVIRLRNAPARRQRASRFYGSHTGAAWLVLFMIFNVIWTLFLYRGAQINTGVFPFESGAFASEAVAKVLEPLGEDTNEILETVGILAQIGVVLGFLVLVVYSKHLHIFLAPLNVLTKREPQALGPLLPMTSGGKPIDFEDPGEDDVFGRGKVEDFTWKGMLDFSTCTECGRCQDQCPAWNTGKPLSPKLVIMDLRDHLFAKAPVILGADGAAVTGIEEAGNESADRASTGRHHGVPESGFGRIPEKGAAQAARPLVGTEAEGGVIDPDVLWSCTTCGACVEQCPVDIEHVDHIMDMRRFQVLIESSFPSEAGTMLKNLETKGNPWGLNARARLDWTEGLDFKVPVVGEDVEDLSEVDYLYWVGCAGALEDRAKKTTRAFAELLHIAGVRFAVLGEAEACSGDPARRLGNEFVFQMLAQQNVETLNEEGNHDRRHLPALFQQPGTGVPAGRRQVRRRPPHPAAVAAGRRGQADPNHARRQPGDLPRPVLPGSAQQGLHAAARDPRQRPAPALAGDAPVQGARLLLRRRGRPDVDGGEDRQAGQRRACRRGARAGPRHRVHRLPVLPGHARRRGHREEAGRVGPRGRRGRRRRAVARAVGTPCADHRHPRRCRPGRGPQHRRVSPLPNACERSRATIRGSPVRRIQISLRTRRDGPFGPLRALALGRSGAVRCLPMTFRNR